LAGLLCESAHDHDGTSSAKSGTKIALATGGGLDRFGIGTVVRLDRRGPNIYDDAAGGVGVDDGLYLRIDGGFRKVGIDQKTVG